jgi:hypothetical protein
MRNGKRTKKREENEGGFSERKDDINDNK